MRVRKIQKMAKSGHCRLNFWLWVTATTTALLLASLPTTLGQDKEFSVLQRYSLIEYSLAKCTDGTPAAYYADRVSTFPCLGLGVQGLRRLVNLFSVAYVHWNEKFLSVVHLNQR